MYSFGLYVSARLPLHPKILEFYTMILCIAPGFVVRDAGFKPEPLPQKSGAYHGATKAYYRTLHLLMSYHIS